MLTKEQIKNKSFLFQANSIVDDKIIVGHLISNKLGYYIVTENNPHICNQYLYMEIDEFEKVKFETIKPFKE